ncbi:hypothetical protein DFR79_1186 [Halanaerobium saccharolyticum]|uniref:Uncharacterized protein n=1 Tax=Halanaerobium saccharolyticum TaxID=43595 RepID=A0A4R6LMK0_9FIRM|nr:hypothetical protein [Halanaerobium saccharolyticum]TDO85240.1 hypothetical protein DFR79_1186 [Halanaerobium saccharolyticum]
MKVKVRFSGIMIFVFLFLSLSLLATADLVEAASDQEQKLKREARVSVKVNIPIFQRLEIIEKPNINYAFLMDNYNGSREIVLEEALTIEVLSNADWHLRLNNRNLNSHAMIRKSGQSDSEWQNLNSTTAKFNGENGEQRITFDLKFILDQSSRAAVNNLALDLRHSLAPELY